MRRSNATAVISLDEYRSRRQAERCRIEEPMAMTNATSATVGPMLPGVAWMPVVWVVGWWLPATHAAMR